MWQKTPGTESEGRDVCSHALPFARGWCSTLTNVMALKQSDELLKAAASRVGFELRMGVVQSAAEKAHNVKEAGEGKKKAAPKKVRLLQPDS